MALELLLAESGRDMDVDVRDADNNTALHLAAKLGFLPCVQALLESC